MIKAIIFDLDGTICDTLTDLGECTNQALADFNLPPHKIEEYRKIVGNGVDTQMRRAIGEEKYTKELADQVKAAFKAYYDKNYLRNTKPYEGMEEALDELSKMGLKLAVFSNKPDEFAGKLCRTLFPVVPPQNDHIYCLLKSLLFQFSVFRIQTRMGPSFWVINWKINSRFTSFHIL